MSKDIKDNKVYVLFEGDQYLSKDRLICIGVFSSVDKAVDSLIEESTNKDINWDILREKSQIVFGAFGYGYIIFETEIDKLGELTA